MFDKVSVLTVVTVAGDFSSDGYLVDCCKNATSSRFCFKYDSVSHQKVKEMDSVYNLQVLERGVQELQDYQLAMASFFFLQF